MSVRDQWMLGISKTVPSNKGKKTKFQPRLQIAAKSSLHRLDKITYFQKGKNSTVLTPFLLLKSNWRGLPWWRSGWESACQCRGHGYEPWSGKIPHAAERLGPWATTTEPKGLEPVPRNKRGRNSERPVHRNEEWPPLAATRESPRTEMKTQHRQK